MARRFNGTTDVIQLALGTLGVFGPGAIGMIVKKASDGTSFVVPVGIGASSDPTSWYPYLDNGAAGNVGFWTGSTDATQLTNFLLASEGFALLVLWKPTGTATLTASKYVYGTATWTHSTGMGALANSVAPDTGAALGALKFSGGITGAFPGDIEIAGVSSSAPASTAALEALGLQGSYSAWQSFFNVALWPLNQASIATAVTDTTGHGADQTAITGTTVVSGPAGFSYGTTATKAPSPRRRFHRALLIR